MIGTAQSYADRFVQSLAIRDFASLGGLFAPEVQFRALLPLGLREAHYPLRRSTTAVVRGHGTLRDDRAYNYVRR